MIPTADTTGEADLVRSARSGDRDAFAELYGRYARAIHGLLLSRVPPSAAEDLVQDVFLTALRKLPLLREAAAFPAWITSIARNCATDYYRSRRHFVQDEIREPSVEPESLMILKIIQSLPEAYRETLVLRLVEGMSGPEIAERTGLTPDSVRVNLHRGMRLLKQTLGERP